MYHHQILSVKDWKSVTMQDQSQGEDTVSLYRFVLSRGVTTLRPVLMYYIVVYANEFDALDRLWTATFVVWRIAS
jgi:hypothetical protein